MKSQIILSSWRADAIHSLLSNDLFDVHWWPTVSGRTISLPPFPFFSHHIIHFLLRRAIWVTMCGCNVLKCSCSITFSFLFSFFCIAESFEKLFLLGITTHYHVMPMTLPIVTQLSRKLHTNLHFWDAFLNWFSEKVITKKTYYENVH